MYYVYYQGDNLQIQLVLHFMAGFHLASDLSLAIREANKSPGPPRGAVLLPPPRGEV